MELIFFAHQSDFRTWLEKNHNKEQELWVGYYKKATKKPSLTWSESVDQALCFGWIDGLRKSIDEESYKIRFTPRKPNSNWSAVNLKKMEELKKKGLMMPAGIAIFEKRNEKKIQQYSFERENVRLDATFEKKFKENIKAWDFFQKMPPSYRKPAIWWVMSAKQEATRQKRLDLLIQCSEEGKKIPQLRRKNDAN